MMTDYEEIDDELGVDNFQERVVAFNKYILETQKSGEVYDLIIENYENFGFTDDDFPKILQQRLRDYLQVELKRKKIIKKMPNVFL